MQTTSSQWMDKIQAEFVMFKSIAGLRNWLQSIFLRDMRVLDVGRKFECRAGPFGGQYRHLMGPAGVGLDRKCSETNFSFS
jgi:hypothetical protein